MTNKLRNSLIEALIVVGADSDSGLRIQRDEPGFEMNVAMTENAPDLSRLFGYAFDPRVIAIILHDKAVFPFWELQTDYRYPPIGYRKKQLAKRLSSMDVSSSRSVARRESKSHQPSSLLSEKQDDKRRRSTRKQSRKTVETSCSNEFIDTLPPFCFPDRMKVYSERQEPVVHHFIRTELSGTRYYVVCYTYTRKYYATRQQEGNTSFRLYPEMPDDDIEGSQSSQASSDDAAAANKDAHTETNASESNKKQKSFVECYVPHCVVAVSSQTYFGTMKSCLTLIGDQLELPDVDFRFCLESAAFQLFCTCIPPNTNVAVRFRFMDQQMQLLPPYWGGKARSALDFEIYQILNCLTFDQLVTLYIAVLTEQKIVLFSSNYALLTIITQSIFELIYPFCWPHVCVPILPAFLLELLDAPNAYIMGCHIDKKQRVQWTVHDAIFFDLDNGEVSLGREVPELPKLPEQALSLLLEGLSTVSFDFQRHCLARQDFFSIEKFASEKNRFSQEANKRILTAFSRVFIQLFGDIETYSMRDQRFFNKQAFLRDRPQPSQKFYQAVLDSTLFTAYLKERWSGDHELYPSLLRHIQNRGSVSGGVRDKRKASAAPITTVPEITSLFTDDSGASLIDLPEFCYQITSRAISSQENSVPSQDRDKEKVSRKSKLVFKPIANLWPGSHKAKSMGEIDEAVDSEPQDVFVTPVTYHEQCVTHFTRLLETLERSGRGMAQSKQHENLKACLLYNRAFYKLALQKASDCLKDLDKAASLNRALITKELIEQIWLGQLTLQQRADIINAPNFRQEHCHICDLLEPVPRGSLVVLASDTLTEEAEEGETDELQPIPIAPEPISIGPGPVISEARIRMTRTLPQTAVAYDEFCKIMQIFQITSDQDLLERFCDVLFIPERTTLTTKLPRHSLMIQPDMLQMFVEKWRANEMLTNDACDPRSLQPNESVLKVSGLCKSDRGAGRLLLTENRLLFLSEGRKEGDQICLIKQITAIERTQSNFLLMIFPELKITFQPSPNETVTYKIVLKNERDAWFFLVSELLAGHWLASQTMDLSMVHQAAETILIMDALIEMCREDLCVLRDHIEQVIAEMSYFTQLKKHTVGELNSDQNRVSVASGEQGRALLRHRISPNAFSEKRAVDVLLYVPALVEEETEACEVVVHDESAPSSATSAAQPKVIKVDMARAMSEAERMPKLWVALNGSNSRKVFVYDASTWVLEYDGSNQKFNNRITAMVYVKTVDQVWVASADAHIYAICARTYMTVKVYRDHTDQIGSMISFYTRDSAMVLHERVVSATVSGELLSWFATATKPERRVTLTMQMSMTGLWYTCDDRLWCKVTNNSKHKDEILVLSLSTWGPLKRISCNPTKDQESSYDRIGGFAVVTAAGQNASSRKVNSSPPDSFWVALRDQPILSKYDANTYSQLEIFDLVLNTGSDDKVIGFSCMTCLNNKLWIGTDTGDLLIFGVDNMQFESRVSSVHPETAVRSIVTADELYVLTGGGSADGKIAIWKPKKTPNA